MNKPFKDQQDPKARHPRPGFQNTPPLDANWMQQFCVGVGAEEVSSVEVDRPALTENICKSNGDFRIPEVLSVWCC